jgi:hypothetical protein
MPLTPEVEIRGNYCAYCADEQGNLFAKEQVKHGVKAWLQSWGPPADELELERRAEAYLAAMPAWSDPAMSP